MKALLLAFALVTTGPLHAASVAELVLNDGTKLADARIASIADERVMIVHPGGILTVHPDLVPLDALARAQMEIEARRNDPEQQQLEEMAAQRAARTDELERTQEEIDRLAKAKRNLDAQSRQAYVKVFQVIPNVGYLVSGSDAYSYVETTQSVRSTEQDTGLKSHLKKYVYRNVTTATRVPAGLGEIFLVRGPTRGIFDGQVRLVRLWRVGEYHYTTTLNAGKTIPSYTRDPIEFLDFISPPSPTKPVPASSKGRIKF